MRCFMNYSKQREVILDYVNKCHCHPTANKVYNEVKKVLPKISFSTVYRNLNLLADLGEAIKITTPNGGDRFDGRIFPHYHFCCTSCGKVEDLDLEELTFVNEAAAKNFEGIIESHAMMFYGKCRDCVKAN